MRNFFASVSITITCSLLFIGCNTQQTKSSNKIDNATLFSHLSKLCGQSFAGEIEIDTPPPKSDDLFHGKPLVMHINTCTEQEIRIPFHVGDDHSRTWVLSRVGEHLRLKHDHRHADGSADTLTQYGGDSIDSNQSLRQQFPADEESKLLFERENRSVSSANIWALEIKPTEYFVYELARPNRVFRVRFNLQQIVATPPAAW